MEFEVNSHLLQLAALPRPFRSLRRFRFPLSSSIMRSTVREVKAEDPKNASRSLSFTRTSSQRGNEGGRDLEDALEDFKEICSFFFQ